MAYRQGSRPSEEPVPDLSVKSMPRRPFAGEGAGRRILML
jgi:hypothetical protein